MIRLFFKLIEQVGENKIEAAKWAMIIASFVSSCSLQEQVEELESGIADAYTQARLAGTQAEEATEKANEAQETAEEALSEVRDLESDIRYRN